MELRHLRYFVAVAEELHFGRAAARLHISQPPLSRQIHQLETELDVKLFERRPTGIVLTPGGETLLEGAKTILLEVGRLIRRTQRVSKGEIGKLTVGFRESAMYNGILPSILHAYREQYRNVEMDIVPLSSEEQIEALRTGGIDVGFVHSSVLPESSLNSEVLYEDRIVIAMNMRNPLVHKSRLYLMDLTDQDFIWFPRSKSPRYHDKLLQACRRGGLSINVVQLAPYVGGTAVTLVAAGVGVCFAQETSARLTRPANVILRPVEDLEITAKLHIAWRIENKSPLLETFLDVVRKKRASFQQATCEQPMISDDPDCDAHSQVQDAGGPH